MTANTENFRKTIRKMIAAEARKLRRLPFHNMYIRRVIADLRAVSA